MVLNLERERRTLIYKNTRSKNWTTIKDRGVYKSTITQTLRAINKRSMEDYNNTIFNLIKEASKTLLKNE